MSKLREAKLREGNDLVDEALKALKTGWFTRAEIGPAAEHYSKAGRCFQTAKVISYFLFIGSLLCSDIR